MLNNKSIINPVGAGRFTSQNIPKRRHRRHFVFQEGLTRVSTCDIKTSDYENILVKMKELEDARK